MAVVSTLSNHYKYQKDIGNINLSSDTVKSILMNTTFTFNEDTHATLADVTADQLATLNGYTQNDKTLTGASVTEDDANNKSKTTYDNVTHTASGGSIGPTGSMLFYDDTTADDTVIGCTDYGTDYTIPDGSSLQFQNIQFDSV